MHIIAIGGSDAGISAALRARELEPSTEVTVVGHWVSSRTANAVTTTCDARRRAGR
jgi:glucose-6-phosphate isomerase